MSDFRRALAYSAACHGEYNGHNRPTGAGISRPGGPDLQVNLITRFWGYSPPKSVIKFRSQLFQKSSGRK